MNYKTYSSLALLVGGILTSQGQGTAFTYQGRLNFNNNPANGFYDLRFAVYDASLNGTSVGGPLTNSAVPVSNGLFTATIDFGAGVFAGANRWLEISARTNGSGIFVTLAPRQALTAEPYALYAPNAGTAQTANSAAANSIGGAALQNASITSSKIAAGQVVKSLNNLEDAVTLAAGTNASLSASGNTLTLATPTDWHVLGNAGTVAGANFVGTTDNQALELKAFGVRGLHLEFASHVTVPALFHSDSLNMLGGYSGNSAASGIIGATIAGGGYTYFDFTSIPGIVINYPNIVTNDFGTVGGGWSNLAGLNGTVPGGHENVATGNGSFAAGARARALHAGAFVWADSTAAAFSSTANDQFLVRAAGGVGIGLDNPLHTLHAGSTLGVGTLNGAANQIVIESAAANGRAALLAAAGAGGADSPGRVEVQVEASDSERRAILGTTSNHEIQFRVYNNEVMKIWTNGCIGLQEGSPAAPLHINGPVGTPPLGLNAQDNGLLLGLEANAGYKWIQSYGGDLVLNPVGNRVGIGLTNPSSALQVQGETRTCILTITGGCDLAEPFETSDGALPKGAVVVIDEENPGHLKQSDRAYDSRVAGIISGANGINSGISLRQEGALEAGQNVALSGRVYALADASHSSIKPGDLLTTSATPGHCMKVADHAKAQGAIIGKAMSSLESGEGLVLVLVTLQ